MVTKKQILHEQGVLRLLSYVRNKDINKVKLSASNTWEHEQKKCEICYNLLKDNKRFVTEAVFKNGLGRADILNISDGIVIEIAKSESEASLIRKKAKYPIDLMIIRI